MELYLTNYKHDDHYLMLEKWLDSKGLVIPPKSFFSDCGFCINNIAIGFLFKTNSKQAYIDHVAADPNSSYEDRQLALDFLYKHIEKIALDEGYEIITGLARLPTMKTRFEDNGYRIHNDYTLYYKILERRVK